MGQDCNYQLDSTKLVRKRGEKKKKDAAHSDDGIKWMLVLLLFKMAAVGFRLQYPGLNWRLILPSGRIYLML
jgi:hypothetical protein